MKLSIKLLLFALLTSLNSYAQSVQTKEEIETNRQFKIKCIKRIVKQYTSEASDSEVHLMSTDTASIQFFDSTGRLVKEKVHRFSYLLRKLIYDSKQLVTKELWYFSKLDMYPKFKKPVREEDYDLPYSTVNYYYDSTNRLSSTIEANGKKATYQYNGNGYMIGKIEVENYGQVSYFEINKYGTGSFVDQLEQSVSSTHGILEVRNFYYDSLGKLKNSKSTYDSSIGDKDGKVRLMCYNDKGKPITDELFDKVNYLIAKFEYTYGKYGLVKITSYREPWYRSWTEPRVDKIRLSEEEFYEYETY